MDGEALNGDLVVDRSERSFEIVVEAPGYAPARRMVSAMASRDIEIRLQLVDDARIRTESQHVAQLHARVASRRFGVRGEIFQSPVVAEHVVNPQRDLAERETG